MKNPLAHFGGPVYFAVCFLFSVHLGFAAVESIDPNIAAEIRIDSTGFTLDAAPFAIDVIQNPPTVEKRGIFEFSLASIAPDAIIASASLEVSVTIAGQGAVPIHGYAGNGVAEITDWITPTESQIGTSEPLTTNGSTVSVPLETEFIESLLGSATHLGILILGSENQMESSFGSLLATPAVLKLTIPDPGDFNVDDTVDGLDFLAWQRGESPMPLSASDLAEWEAAYTTPVVSAVASVPEPGALALVAWGVVMVSARRGGHR